MMKILKNLFLKFVVICLSICLLVNTTAYGIPTLRSNSIFDKINEKEDKGRVSVATNVVESKNAFREKVRTIFESLRPDFHKKKKLTVKEFEEHIRLKAEELGISYKKTKGNLFNFLYYNLPMIIRYVRVFDFKMAIDTFLFTLIMSVAPHARRYSYSKRGGSNPKETKIKIVVPGESTLLIQVWSALLLVILGSPQFYLEIWPLLLYLGISGMVNMIIDITANATLLHELKHTYVFLLKHMLVENGLIKESVRILAVDGYKENLLATIDEKDINRLEGQVLEVLADNSIDTSDDLRAQFVLTDSAADEPNNLEMRRFYIETIEFLAKARNQL